MGRWYAESVDDPMRSPRRTQSQRVSNEYDFNIPHVRPACDVSHSLVGTCVVSREQLIIVQRDPAQRDP